MRAVLDKLRSFFAVLSLTWAFAGGCQCAGLQMQKGRRVKDGLFVKLGSEFLSYRRRSRRDDIG